MTKKRKLWIPIVSIVLVAALVGGHCHLEGQHRQSGGGLSGVQYLRLPIGVTPPPSAVTSPPARCRMWPPAGQLIQSINVNAGDTVSAGDVLMVYDTTSFQLTLQIRSGQNCGAGEQHTPGHSEYHQV